MEFLMKNGWKRGPGELRSESWQERELIPSLRGQLAVECPRPLPTADKGTECY